MAGAPSSTSRWYILLLWSVSVIGPPVLADLILADIGVLNVPLAVIPFVFYWLVLIVGTVVWRRTGVSWKSLFSTVKKFLVDFASRIGYWWAFSVVVAVVPILLNMLISPLARQGFDIEKVLAHGELLAISLALMGEAVGYLLVNTKVKGWFKGVWGFASFAVCLGSVSVLSVIIVFDIEHNNIDLSSVSLYSWITFLATLVVGSFCKWTER